MISDVAGLREAVDGGAEFKYFLFWGHRQKQKGVPDASCLSQWFPASFVINGLTYATAEHWMMAGKAKLFDDEAMWKAIVASSDPSEAKALGRRVAGYDDEVWKTHRFRIVVEGSIAKFSQNPPLQRLLLNTGDQVLVEASPRDRIWGIGLGRNNDKATDPRQWRGTNLLGFALMVARARIRETQ